MDLAPVEVATVARAAELHDVGKMAIPDAILEKPGPLDEEEWEFMRQHTILGERILVGLELARPRSGKIVRASHERWDGKGYPDGLKGEEIPLAARIVFVCDAYDAMISRSAPTRPPSASRRGARRAARERRHPVRPAVVEAFMRVVKSVRAAQRDNARAADSAGEKPKAGRSAEGNGSKAQQAIVDADTEDFEWVQPGTGSVKNGGDSLVEAD